MKKTLINLVSTAVILGSFLPSISFGQTTGLSSGVNNLPSPTSVCFSIDSNLSVGARDRMTNGSVINLQAFLRSRGHLKAEPTGYFGALTLQAVKDFQRANGLPPTGFFGAMSRAKMRVLTCNEVPEPTPTVSGVTVSVKTDKQIYTQDESVTFQIVASNTTNEQKTLNFNTGCQVNYTIDNTYNSQAAELCSMSLTSRILPARGTLFWNVTHASASYKLSPGTHAIKGTVLGYGSATTYITVVAGNSSSPMTVTSPNGGETLQKGKLASIVWSTRTNTPSQNAGLSYAPPVTIKLKSYIVCITTPCEGQKYTIADNYPGSTGTYSWTIGNLADNTVASNGNYQIEVCVANTTICDTSDNYFTITDAAASAAPVINSLSSAGGYIGSQVTVYGSGFSSTGNTVNLGAGVIPNITSSNGSSLTFTVPTGINLACFYSQPRCLVATQQLTPGTYKISVENSNHVKSNEVSFTVVGQGLTGY
jgi:peptidoglycan hydrolase-like protein with peptidoglycan-binding domain